MAEKDPDISALGQRLFSLENLYRAYRRCRRHKRNTLNALRFEQDLEENLVALHEELAVGTYRPGRAVAFLVEKPKRREIFAADFRDRVVHHVLVGYLEPRWERRFIHDSYACRQGKGTHKGVERLRAFTCQVTANGTRRAWYLQLDVRGFFNSIDRDILYARLARAEAALIQHGLILGKRPVYPWHWPTLVAIYRWLNAYLAHVRRAASHRLVEQLWQRFSWLAEYYRREGERVVYTVSPPWPALRLDQQKAQFSSRLPGHILVAQLGNWYELWGGSPDYPLPPAWRRFHSKRLPALKHKLWASGAPVAWIAENGPPHHPDQRTGARAVLAGRGASAPAGCFIQRFSL